MYTFLITHYKVSLTFKLCLFSCLSPERGGFFKTSRSHREREEKKENERRRKQQRSEQSVLPLPEDPYVLAPPPLTTVKHSRKIRATLIELNLVLFIDEERM
ncbi:hypothetical protein Bca101_040703 [Brassica carinata]